MENCILSKMVLTIFAHGLVLGAKNLRQNGLAILATKECLTVK